ncbi:MAG: hypothetical protein ACFFD2_22785, partial [Promethearchaeota archaeon]
EGSFQPDKRDYEIRINTLDKIPSKIILNSRELALDSEKLTFDKKNRTLKFSFSDDRKEVQIELSI